MRVTSDMQEVANELSEAADRSSDPKRGFEATGGSEAQPPEDRNANKKLKMEDNGFSRKAED